MALLAASLPAAAAAQPLAAEGERVFQQCYACHSVNPRERGLPGPNLAGVVGRRAAAQADFDYSPAMRRAGTRGLVWSEALLNRYLADPDAVVPQGEMTFLLRNARDRRAVIAYLKTRKVAR